MQELEKILGEIRVKSIELKNKHWGDDERNLTGKGVEGMCVQAEQIIRKHMNGDERFEFDFMNVKSFDCQCGRHYVNIGVARNDGWIPVDERLPQENQEVWITTKYGEVKRAMYTEHSRNDEVKIFLLIGGCENIDEISARQPYYVPEPYSSKYE